MISFNRLAALGLYAACLSAAAQTATPESLYARSLAATCANCHGTAGVSVPGSSVGSLAGMDASYLKAQMTAFKTGARPATVMHQLSKGFNDEQINSLAAYFAAQKK